MKNKDRKRKKRRNIWAHVTKTKTWHPSPQWGHCDAGRLRNSPLSARGMPGLTTAETSSTHSTITTTNIHRVTQKLYILEYFEYFCQMSSKSILIILSYIVSKFARFFWDSVELPVIWFKSWLNHTQWFDLKNKELFEILWFDLKSFQIINFFT